MLTAEHAAAAVVLALGDAAASLLLFAAALRLTVLLHTVVGLSFVAACLLLPEESYEAVHPPLCSAWLFCSVLAR